MQVVSHIYKSKLGRLYVLEPQKLIDGKLKCWIGTEIIQSRNGYEFITTKGFKGGLKKDVIKEIKSSENQVK
jgi:hypothetical protein